jgi:hypothetical protein
VISALPCFLISNSWPELLNPIQLLRKPPASPAIMEDTTANVSSTKIY